MKKIGLAAVAAATLAWGTPARTQGIVNLTGGRTRSTERQCHENIYAAIRTHVSCRHTRKALARTWRY